MHLKLIKRVDVAENYTGPHLQMPLPACMNAALDNPFLNSLYKSSVSFTERWYLEVRKKILEENWKHPIVKVVCQDENLKKLLVKSTVIDGAIMRSVLSDPLLPGYHISAGINLKKLNRWCGFFVSLPGPEEIHTVQYGQVLD